MTQRLTQGLRQLFPVSAMSKDVRGFIGNCSHDGRPALLVLPSLPESLVLIRRLATSEPLTVVNGRIVQQRLEGLPGVSLQPVHTVFSAVIHGHANTRLIVSLPDQTTGLADAYIDVPFLGRHHRFSMLEAALIAGDRVALSMVPRSLGWQRRLCQVVSLGKLTGLPRGTQQEHTLESIAVGIVERLARTVTTRRRHWLAADVMASRDCQRIERLERCAMADLETVLRLARLACPANDPRTDHLIDKLTGEKAR